jgi:dolichyl-phosphate beta-glucosyltransferase
MPTLIAALEQGADVAIGSRALQASLITGHLAGLRTSMGRAFNVIVRVITRCRLRDTECGFKGFRGEDRFGFDVEVLWLARRFGYGVVEVPVTCHYHGANSVCRVRDCLSMLVDLVRIRWYDRTGRYDR